MSTRKRGLGKGIEALIGKKVLTAPVQAELQITQKSGLGIEGKEVLQEGSVERDTYNSNEKDGTLTYLPVEFLQPGRYQPRRELDPDALQDLSQSIKAQGIMQPIVVRAIVKNKYEIIAGERRWRASQLAKLEKVPCIIREVSDEATIALSLIENIQREDLTPIEEAIALQRLQQEFDLTHQQVADSIGKSRATVSNLLRLLALSEDVKKMLDSGDLEMGHARALLSLPEAMQTKVARHVVAKSFTVRQTEDHVRRVISESADKAENKLIPKVVNDPNISQLQERLSLRVGAPVRIQHTQKGKGKLVINYNSLDELDGILGHIR